MGFLDSFGKGGWNPYKCLMPELIRHPDVVPTKVGNHLMSERVNHFLLFV